MVDRQQFRRHLRYGVNNITIYQSVFDHNGWCIPANSYDNGYDHNIYMSSSTTGVDIERNIIANGSYAGIMARSGGIINDNLFVGNSVAVAYGLANGANSTVGGVTGSLSVM